MNINIIFKFLRKRTNPMRASVLLLKLLIGVIALIFLPSSVAVCEKQQKLFVKQLIMVKGKVQSVRKELDDQLESKASTNEADFADKTLRVNRYWVIHNFFKEVISLQKMMGNYCKGEQHYKEFFKIDTKSLEGAIEEMNKTIKEWVSLDKEEKEWKYLSNLIYYGQKLIEHAKNIETAVHEYHQKQGRLGLDKESDSTVIKNQEIFDNYLKGMKDAASQEKNPYEKLLNMDQLLTLVDNLWNAIVDTRKTQEKGTRKQKEMKRKREKSSKEISEEEQTVIKAYNVFARKLDHYMDNGALSRNVFGEFNLASFDQKLAEMDDKNNKNTDENPSLLLLDKEILLLIRQLLYIYNQLHLPQMDMLKMRGTYHMVLVLGLIEYDFGYGGPRRRKFKEELDDVTSECSPNKVSLIARPGIFVKLSQMDRIFYQMAQQGWDTSSYDGKMGKVCRTFVWNFLCNLFNGNCPGEGELPQNFLQMDRKSTLGSVFNEDGKYRFPFDNHVDYNDKCVLKPLKVMFTLDRMGVSKEKQHTEFPLRFIYQPGKFYYEKQQQNETGKQKILLEQVFTDEQQLEEIFINSGSTSRKTAKPAAVHFTAQLMVYSCKVQGNKEVAYVKQMGVADKTHEQSFPSLLNIQINGQWMEEDRWLNTSVLEEDDDRWIRDLNLVEQNEFPMKSFYQC